MTIVNVSTLTEMKSEKEKYVISCKCERGTKSTSRFSGLRN